MAEGGARRFNGVTLTMEGTSCWHLTGIWTLRGRCGGLMVSALDSGSGGPGSSPGRGTASCSWARHFTLIVPLFTQVYKWVPVMD